VEPALTSFEQATAAAVRMGAGAGESLTRRRFAGILQRAHGRECSRAVESRGEEATFLPRRLMALRRSGSGKPDTSSLHRIGSSCQDEDGAITAIDGWRRGSPGSVKVAHLLAATDMG